MTDPKPTTNEQIALELGYRQITIGNAPQRWVSPTGDRLSGGVIPDFEHDGAFTMPLLEDLSVAGFEIEILLFEGKVHCSLSTRPYLDREEGPAGSGDILTEAISRAWLAWKKEE